MSKIEKKKGSHSLFTSILLLLMAVAAVTAVTMAWLSIADSTRLHSMSIDVTTGASLRFDLDPHDAFDEYVQSLNFNQIAARIQQEQGFNLEETPLEPVTTSDFSVFTFEDGQVVNSRSGAYLLFTLNFMSTQDMVVHLTSAGDPQGGSGTAVTSSNPALPQAMRISFTVDGTTYVYDPGMGAGSSQENGYKVFGLPAAADMTYTQDNAMFSLTAEENKSVEVHIWLEGTDPACTDELKGADYSIALRFEGTDAENRTFAQ